MRTSSAEASRLSIVARALAAAVIVAAAALGALVAVAQPDAAVEAPPAREVLRDRPACPDVPLYTQTDERWADLPFAGGTVGTHGCGLTCAAMAWEALSGEGCTPADLLAVVGDSCTVDGLNHMPSYCEWMVGHDATLSYSGLYDDPGRAVDDLRDGRLVFGALTGALRDGGREYGGHLVLLAGVDGGLVTVHDPCEAYPVGLTGPELESVSWDYFVSIGRS